MAKSKPAEKKAAAPKDSAKKDSKKNEKEFEAMDKKEVANMLGTLKCSKDPDKKEMLAYYQSLPRFDGQKQELLKKWKADKSCKWFWILQGVQEPGTLHYAGRDVWLCHQVSCLPYFFLK